MGIQLLIMKRLKWRKAWPILVGSKLFYVNPARSISGASSNLLHQMNVIIWLQILISHKSRKLNWMACVSTCWLLRKTYLDIWVTNFVKEPSKRQAWKGTKHSAIPLRARSCLSGLSKQFDDSFQQKPRPSVSRTWFSFDRIIFLKLFRQRLAECPLAGSLPRKLLECF